MKILLLFILYLISVIEESTSQVTAKSGGGVRIKCKYEEGYETNKKYFCKSEETTCSYQIITEAKHTWVHEDRFSLYDDTNAKVFWVVMRNLTVKDSGTYQCGVDITDKAKEDMHTPVKLKVKAATTSDTQCTLNQKPQPLRTALRTWNRRNFNFHYDQSCVCVSHAGSEGNFIPHWVYQKEKQEANIIQTAVPSRLLTQPGGFTFCL
ncbi:CMRF35-like molecule 7 isoform X3 [Electrophorus electricus]|uniref:CMRF35-like molecule 7 isoform X3 n=1 Tax=Electrophorus electricus TaxID=8005 RepID=UPI0015D0CB53|nr:CMRF35-like molecule 7 isoform X3 [Electrophorus electricus]